MFIYLSKKIAIPNCESLNTIAWNNDQNYIATGGNGGLLKVIKLDSAAGSSLSMNQTLEGHTGTVVLTTWNKKHDKLASADASGKIIVWVLYKGLWSEEMVNDRKKGMVAGMKWDKSGSRICIVYEDGAIVLGSVHGKRIWGKEIKSTRFAHVSWSPDGNYLLLATAVGQLQIYDSHGTFVSKLQDYCHPSDFRVAAVDWYDGRGGLMNSDIGRLAICFEDGKVQILRHQRDSRPILFEVGMKNIKMEWNNNGSILAFTGILPMSTKNDDQKDSSVIQFWSPNGILLKSLKVPGGKITAISWESDGLRLAVTMETFIFFASVRPDYNWSFFAKSILVYAKAKSESTQSVVKFCNLKTNDKKSKLVNNLVEIKSASDLCLIMSRCTDGYGELLMNLYNSIGVVVESKYLEFEPKHIALSNSSVIAANENVIFCWQFKRPGATGITVINVMKKKDVQDRAFHIDDINLPNFEQSFFSREMLVKKSSDDPISAITCSDQVLIVSRGSGDILVFNLPSLTLAKKLQAANAAVSMSLNCNSDMLAMVDQMGIFRIFELDSKTKTIESNIQTSNSPGYHDIVKKDVWDFKWASDNPSMFAIMEKTRLVIYNGLEAEEPVPCPGYICSFDNLVVKSASIDDIIKELESEDNLSPLITNTDMAGLRDLKMKLDKEPIENAVAFAKDHSHPRLWQEVAKIALKQLNFDIANSAFVRCQDYQGIQFLKRLKKFDDPQKKKAEVLAYCQEFDEAEKLYLAMDRKDLAVDLRMKLGDWFKVVQLIKSGGIADDAVLEKAWNEIGDYYFERSQWAQAAKYYQQGRNLEKLVDVYIIMEDYASAEKIAISLPETSKKLRFVADTFLNAGMCLPACNAYLKLGDISAAINSCVTLNQWDKAIALAESHQSFEIEGLLTNYANQILGKSRKKEAILLFRKANYCQQSAKLVFELAKEAAQQDQSPTAVKKLYVLGALEVERYFALQRSSRTSGQAAVDKLLKQEDGKDGFIFQKPWRGAEAYHFYLLAQRQFYSGQLVSAVLTALHLRNYDDILGETKVYSLLAFVSLHAGYYGTCSKAFIKLESLENPKDSEYYQSLALEIFINNIPVDPNDDDILICSNCMGSVKERYSPPH